MNCRVTLVWYGSMQSLMSAFRRTLGTSFCCRWFSCFLLLACLRGCVFSCLKAYLQSALTEKLEVIQCHLIELMSSVATPLNSTGAESKIARTRFDGSYTLMLENWIDSFDSLLPTLTKFILPVRYMCFNG